jgi:hypothetical protein
MKQCFRCGMSPITLLNVGSAHPPRRSVGADDRTFEQFCMDMDIGVTGHGVSRAPSGFVNVQLWPSQPPVTRPLYVDAIESMSNLFLLDLGQFYRSGSDVLLQSIKLGRPPARAI